MPACPPPPTELHGKAGGVMFASSVTGHCWQESGLCTHCMVIFRILFCNTQL